MALRRAGGAANAVTAGTATQQDHNITGCGTFPTDIIGRSSGNNSATLQTLSNKALMVQLGNMAGSQTNLVAVGGVTGCGSLADLTLGQLAGQGLAQRLSGITGTGNAHGLMDVSTATEGVADASADAGSSAAEGFDLGGMVVSLVLEHQQPVLLFAIDLSSDMNGAGVDFFALVQLGKQATLL